MQFFDLSIFHRPILAAEEISLGAQKVVSGATWFTISNSFLVTLIVVGLIVLWARRSTAHMQLVPGMAQNLFEWIVETVYETIESVVGRKMAAKTFSMLASLFIFILIANWFGIVPGVGTIFVKLPTETAEELMGTAQVQEQDRTVEQAVDGKEESYTKVPLLRPTTADLNMTLAMALVFMAFWLYWTLQEMGVGGTLNHMFGVKGGLKGMAAIALAPIFFGVGLIEVVSTLFRPVSLSLRLYGNVFAGENLLHSMITLGQTLGLPAGVAWIMSILIPIPFYFLEILIGLLQAMVFALLCAVYIALSTSHDEDAH